MTRRVKSKGNRFLLISGGAVLGIVIVACLAITICGNRIVAAIVRDVLARKPIPGYNITFRALSLNLAAGDILIRDISISPDPANRLTGSIL